MTNDSIVYFVCQKTHKQLQHNGSLKYPIFYNMPSFPVIHTMSTISITVHSRVVNSFITSIILVVCIHKNVDIKESNCSLYAEGVFKSFIKSLLLSPKLAVNETRMRSHV